MKKRLLVILSLVLAMMLGACAPAPAQKDMKSENKDMAIETKKDEEKKDEANKEEMLELTLEELTALSGKNGAKAYIAVDGVIYDVTEHLAWKNGGHNGFEGGQDLTEAIKTKTPHGTSKLDGLKAVGKLK